ncbi:MAG TPA: phytanoyl-CoA dioxygenase family protein [Xanthobacteraceae bacterium]|nr:phytanoyl-CoA dioxygenase family protein [Xanthobacteraceae bacterium]
METFPARYGVKKQTRSESRIDRAAEMIRLLGYAVVNGNYSSDDMSCFSTAFDRALASTYERHGGREALVDIDEHNTIRAPLAIDPLFLKLALNADILSICHQLVDEYVVLNQQNGTINPPIGQAYNQAAFHRDLPYQHFVSSRPLAINALFCLDEFTSENGATCVIPASHKQEDFPSDATALASQVQICAPAGSYIVLDCMLYHMGGVNRTDRPRRAVNHVYSVPIIRPQIDLPAALGPDYTSDPDVRRLLGYDVRVPTSIEGYYAKRARQLNG